MYLSIWLVTGLFPLEGKSHESKELVFFAMQASAWHIQDTQKISVEWMTLAIYKIMSTSLILSQPQHQNGGQAEVERRTCIKAQRSEKVCSV